MAASPPPPVVVRVVEQHAEEAAILRHVRTVLLRAPHVELHRLRRLDDRIEAHLDGLAESGEPGLAALRGMLEAPGTGTVFALVACAIRLRSTDVLRQALTVAATLPAAERGLVSALGWLSAAEVQSTVNALLRSDDPHHRAWALAACAMHRVDPGATLTRAVEDADPRVRASAWRLAGRRGRRDLADAARHELVGRPHARRDQQGDGASVAEAPAEVWSAARSAAWALTLWGGGQQDIVRRALLSTLPDCATPPQDAHRLGVLAAPMEWGRDQVRALAKTAESDASIKRRMFRLAGWVGDVQVAPWLIQHMSDDRWARLAGEMFSLITGCDLVALELERPAPEDVDAQPGDPGTGEETAMDDDESLPWPDQARVSAWWRENAGRFEAGQRYFTGAPIAIPRMGQVLKESGQRRRIMAAEYLCLLEPGRELFPVAAPAWRQSRWLSAIDA